MKTTASRLVRSASKVAKMHSLYASKEDIEEELLAMLRLIRKMHKEINS